MWSIYNIPLHRLWTACDDVFFPLPLFFFAVDVGAIVVGVCSFFKFLYLPHYPPQYLYPPGRVWVFEWSLEVDPDPYPDWPCEKPLGVEKPVLITRHSMSHDLQVSHTLISYFIQWVLLQKSPKNGFWLVSHCLFVIQHWNKYFGDIYNLKESK